MQKVYVITGASSGIGYALSACLAAQDYIIVAIARRAHKLDALRDLYPQNIIPVVSDLGTSEGREFASNQVKIFQSISGLVNNAASNGQVDYLENLTLVNWHKQCAINLDAPIFFTQLLLEKLSYKGRIINITTGPATTKFILSGIAGYAITKSALNTFTKYLSEELKPRNILVTAAHPGVVDTELAQDIDTHPNKNLGIVKAKKRFRKEDRYIDVKLSAKFLSWLLVAADEDLYTGDVVGIYNQKYQLLWNDYIISSPYPDNITPP